MSAKSSLSIVILVSLIGSTGIAMPYPILSPLFLNSTSEINQFLGIDPYVLLGIVLAIYPLGLLLSSSYFGHLSDRHGRKPVLLWTLFFSMFSNALSAWAIVQESYELLLVARFITGILAGNIAVARAIVTDMGDKINQTQSFGYVTAASYGGWFVGPLIGGYLSIFGYQTPFWIASTIYAIAVIVVRFKLDLSMHSTVTNPNKDQRFWLAPGLFAFISIQFIATLAVNIFYEFYPVYLVDTWQANPQTIANATMLCTFAMVACSSLALKPAEHALSKTTLYCLGLIFSGLFIITLTLPNDQSQALLVFIPIGFFIALYNSIAYAWFSERFRSLQQGRLMGTLVATFCLANFCAALVGGWLASFDTRALLIGGGICSIIAALLFLMVNYYLNIHKHALRNNKQDT